MPKNKVTTAQFETAFFEKVLEHSPDFIEALKALGDLYTKEGFIQKGLAVDQKLARLRPDDAVVLYNLACSYSLLNDITRAREAMKGSIEAGYDDLAHLEGDPDLLNLLADDEFSSFYKEVRGRRRTPSSRTK
jgi:tetratricopeptide (TPR) repeat protein